MVRTIFIHESWRIVKQTSERCERGVSLAILYKN